MIAKIPPSHIKPEALFRLLVCQPRARLPVFLSFSGCEHVAFFACAITGHELSMIVDGCDGIPKDLADSKLKQGLALRCLYDDDGPVFTTIEEVGQLDETEINDIWRALYPALDAMSPTYPYSRSGEWEAALQRGAYHPSNRRTAYAMASCEDVTAGFKTVHTNPRPDRYYGKAVSELTDGQLMAYSAARAAVKTD